MMEGKGGGRRRAFAEALAPLAARDFRILWAGQAVSAAGGGMTKVALIFSVLAVDGSVTDIGLVMTAQVLTQVLFTLAGGVWADRLRRQFLMLSSDLIRAAAQLTLAVLLLSDAARVWHLAVGAAIFGGAQAFFGPASRGLMAEVTPPEHLQRANALMSFSTSASTVLSPALAGLLIALWGPGLVLAMDAVTFIVSAASLAMLRLPPRAIPAPASFWRDLGTGWREMAVRRWLWLNMLVHMLQNLAVAAYYVLGPAIADESLGGPSAWGVIVAGFAAGALVGGIVAMKLEPSRPLIVGNLALVLTAVPLLSLAVPMPLWVVVCSAFLSGAATLFLDALWQASMQQLIPAEVMSRVESYDWLISTIAAPLGLAMVGPLASQTGQTQTLLIAAALIVIPCSLTPLVPGIRAVRRAPDGKITGPAVQQPAHV
ncbi:MULTISPECIES: MFS transporter [unclassified Streptomyces]|uniref:MFS transporter n=1 Tax=unclassified Streptomyces TaxID=2593676 RepID=UPI0009A11FF7|nr:MULTISPECIES: MFS transporter [unclassified Streptomyces]